MLMKRNILIMNLAAALIWMSMYTYVPILPAYSASIGASVVMIGIIGGSYGVLQLLLRIPLGLISDRLKKDRLLLIIGFAILTVSCLMFVLQNDNVWMLLLSRGMAGASAAWWVVISASYAKYNKEDRQVKAQGTLQASANIGKFSASLLCAVIAQFLGYRAVFIASLGVAAVGLVIMFGLKDKKEEPTEPVSIKEQLLLIKNKDIIIFSVLGILSQLICFATATTFTPVAAEAIGANSFDLGILVLIFFLFTAAASLLVGTKVYRKLGGVHFMAISFVAGAISCIPAFYHSSMFMIYVSQALAGVCYGITQSVMAGFVIRSVSASQRGAATGIFQSLFSIGILVGPVLMGFMIDATSFDAAYWVMAAVMVLSAALCYVLIPRKYKQLT